MEHLYYCPHCDYLYSANEDNLKDFKCNNCGKILIPTHFSLEEWRKKNSNEKEEIKKKLTESLDSSNNVQHTTTKNPITASPTSSQSNIYGNALNKAGFIIIILSIIVAFTTMEDNFAIGIIGGLSGFLSGLLLLGFGEIINLLQDIKYKL